MPRYFLKENRSPLQTGDDSIAKQALADGYREVDGAEFVGGSIGKVIAPEKKPQAKASNGG